MPTLPPAPDASRPQRAAGTPESADMPGEPPSAARQQRPASGFEIVDFQAIQPMVCPCGMARRAFSETPDFPGTIHVTDISADARPHYHRRLTETYYILECAPDAKMQLDDQCVPLRPGMAVLIRPGVRHRALGSMRVLIVVFPKFDPQDEWFDDE